jgi:hypothetical protein
MADLAGRVALRLGILATTLGFGLVDIGSRLDGTVYPCVGRRRSQFCSVPAFVGRAAQTAKAPRRKLPTESCEPSLSNPNVNHYIRGQVHPRRGRELPKVWSIYVDGQTG